MSRPLLSGGLATALLLSMGLTACATVEDTAHVPYAAHGAPAAGVQSIRVTVTAADARTTNRGRISTKKNGYGMDMAAIRSDADVADIVKGALSDELRTRGYQLAAGGPVVDAQVKTFYNDFEVGIFAGGAKGTVDLTITVTRDGRTLYTRSVQGAQRKTVAMASGKNAGEAIAMALGAALDQLFADPAFTAALAAG